MLGSLLEDRIKSILNKPEEHLRKSIEFLSIKVDPETILAFIASELYAEAHLLYLMKYRRSLAYDEKDKLLYFLMTRIAKIRQSFTKVRERRLKRLKELKWEASSSAYLSLSRDGPGF